MNGFVRFIDEMDIGRIKDDFHDIKHFPGVIGCIDGTHVWITAPHDHEMDFVNRKGYHSINVQVICDHIGKWIKVVAKWPGSAWDTMESRRIAGIILGDSGYPCRNWLMTPLLAPHTPAEFRCNSAHKATRVRVEQAIGRWKRRFHILHAENRMRSPESVCVPNPKSPETHWCNSNFAQHCYRS